MTSPDDSADLSSVRPGTDISVDPADLAEPTDEAPATSDPDELDDDGAGLGGTGGGNAGGAG